MTSQKLSWSSWWQVMSVWNFGFRIFWLYILKFEYFHLNLGEDFHMEWSCIHFKLIINQTIIISLIKKIGIVRKSRSYHRRTIYFNLISIDNVVEVGQFKNANILTCITIPRKSTFGFYDNSTNCLFAKRRTIPCY